MTLQESKDKLAAATSESDRQKWQAVVRLKEARIAAGGPEEIIVQKQYKHLPIGENPHDSSFND